MKTKLFLFLCLFLSIFTLNAQPFAYQAYYRNADGYVLPNTAVGVKLQVYNTNEGQLVYDSLFSAKTDDFGGLFFVINSPRIDLSQPLWIEVVLDGVTHGKERIYPVSNAHHAERAKLLGNFSAEQLITMISSKADIGHTHTDIQGFSGNYSDLKNKPNISDSLAKIRNEIATKSDTHLHPYAAEVHDHLKSDITDLANASASQEGLMSVADKVKLDGIESEANKYIHPVNHPANMITGLADIATTGSYSDLKDKPAIPTTQVNSDWNATTGVEQILNKPELFSGNYSDLQGIPAVFDSNYNDLKNKPNISDSLAKIRSEIATKSDIHLHPYASDLHDHSGVYLESFTETDPTISSWAKEATKPGYTFDEVGAAAQAHHHDTTYLKSFTETDPTISAWAKEATKPGYTFEEVGAAAQAHHHDTVYLKSFTETDPTISSWAKEALKPGYTFEEVGAAAQAHHHDTVYLKSFTETDPTVSSWAKEALKPGYTFDEVGAAAQAHHHDTVYLKSFTENDPTISSWAKEATKPGYTFDEVGAAAQAHHHDTVYLKSFIETDPTVSSWAKEALKPGYTFDEVGAAAEVHAHLKSDITDFSHSHTNADIPPYPSSLPPSGSAGGDLTGEYPSPTIKENVSLAGIPTAPTAAQKTNTTQIATTEFVMKGIERLMCDSSANYISRVNLNNIRKTGVYAIRGYQWNEFGNSYPCHQIDNAAEAEGLLLVFSRGDGNTTVRFQIFQFGNGRYNQTGDCANKIFYRCQSGNSSEPWGPWIQIFQPETPLSRNSVMSGSDLRLTFEDLKNYSTITLTSNALITIPKTGPYGYLDFDVTFISSAYTSPVALMIDNYTFSCYFTTVNGKRQSSFSGVTTIMPTGLGEAVRIVGAGGYIWIETIR